MYNPGELPCREVRLVTETTWKKALSPSPSGIRQPIADCLSGLVRELEIERPGRFPLDHPCTGPHPAPHPHILPPEPHQVTAPQLAVDGKIEKREITST